MFCIGKTRCCAAGLTVVIRPPFACGWSQRSLMLHWDMTQDPRLKEVSSDFGKIIEIRVGVVMLEMPPRVCTEGIEPEEGVFYVGAERYVDDAVRQVRALGFF